MPAAALKTSRMEASVGLVLDYLSLLQVSQEHLRLAQRGHLSWDSKLPATPGVPVSAHAIMEQRPIPLCLRTLELAALLGLCLQGR
eukprot:295781-Amphidinium_carterae.1